jgi:hypothetical protein
VVASSNIILAKWVCLREKLIYYIKERGQRSVGELLCAVLATFVVLEMATTPRAERERKSVFVQRKALAL